jgi:H+/gluconate symporter-like permease
VLASHLESAGVGLSSAIASDATAYVATLNTLPPSPQKDEIIRALAAAFQAVFGFLTGISGLYLVLSLLVKTASMDKDLASEHILRKGEEKQGEKEGDL